MSDTIYDMFRDLARVGMPVTVYLKADGVLKEKHGIIRRISDEGVLIQNSLQSTFVSADAVVNFTISQRHDGDDAQAQTLSTTGDGVVGISKNVPPPPKATADDDVPEPIDDRQFDVFLDPIQLSPPKPDFTVSDLSRDDHADLIRWKNRYDYAVKISELARVVDDVRPIGRLAERLRHPDLYLLAGSIAIAAKAYELAEPQLTNAVALGSARGAVALTWLACVNNDPNKAVEMACRAIAIDLNAFGAQDASILFLGRLLARLTDKDAPGIGDALAPFVGTEAENLSNTLIAFALKQRYPAAAKAAWSGRVAEAKLLSVNARVFQSLPIVSVGLSQRPPSPKAQFDSSRPKIEEFGRVTAAYPEKACGFLVNEVTNETLYFSFAYVTDQNLLDDVENGLVGHKVYFTVRPIIKSLRAKYDQAHSIRLRADQSGSLIKTKPTAKLSRKDGDARLEPRLGPLPRNKGPYAEAKKAEYSGSLERAESLFRQTIQEGGGYRQSAIKDLAMLLGRKNRPLEGIQILEEHRGEFDSTRSADNLKAILLIKAKKYKEAANLYVSLYNSAPAGTRERVGLAKQAGVCFTVILDFTNALKYLEAARVLTPDDVTNNDLIAKVRDAKAKGTLSVDDTRKLQELAGLAVSSGLSSFANFFIQMSDFKGADERSITRGFFEAGDFRKIDRQLRAIRGRQPRMKGQLYQTLAAMSVKAPLDAGDLSIQEALRSCFFFMGEAAINDNLAVDSVRCFLSEAAHLALREDQAGDIARYLLNTYLSAPLSTEELTKTGGPLGSVHLPVQRVVELFEQDQIGWDNLLRDFPYYAAVAEYAANIIESEINRNHNLRSKFPSRANIEALRSKEIGRIQGELTVLRPLIAGAITGDGLRHISDTLNERAGQTRFKLDQDLLYQLSRLTSEASRYWTEQDYIEREAIFGRITGGLKALSDAIKKEPTRLTIEAVLPLADRLLGEIIADFDKFRAGSTASLSLNNLLKDDYYIPDQDEVITLSLELTSDRGSTPIEGIALTVTSDDDRLVQVEACHSPELLRGGGRREIQVGIKPSRAQLADQAFTIQVETRYHNRAGNKVEERVFSLPIAIGASDSFEEIYNPYAAYSGGRIVSDVKMLFGRSDLLTRIKTQVADGPLGQCFVLYGQKRSGKSSVLYRLKELLSRPQLGVLLTIGTMDIYQAETSFVRQCIDTINERLEDIGIPVNGKPSLEEVNSTPLRAFQTFIKTALNSLELIGWEGPRIVLLIDEFTYLFEYIKESIIPNSFMRQWKALLELGLFSAVVVGQDSMPKFKQAFANEFGVTHDERISYLSTTAARDLAERPILLGGSSRYRGRAMDRLIEYTAGSPFYLQIMCDHLVRHLNRRKRIFVTEADVDQVARDLTAGAGFLPIERFDPLITAAGESVAEASRDTYLSLLTAIAHASRTSEGARLDDIPALENRAALLKDLRERDVLVIDASGRYSIQVGLFAEWLRVNEPASL
jgi:hypothetical protein